MSSSPKALDTPSPPETLNDIGQSIRLHFEELLLQAGQYPDDASPTPEEISQSFEGTMEMEAGDHFQKFKDNDWRFLLKLESGRFLQWASENGLFLPGDESLETRVREHEKNDMRKYLGLLRSALEVAPWTLGRDTKRGAEKAEEYDSEGKGKRMTREDTLEYIHKNNHWLYESTALAIKDGLTDRTGDRESASRESTDQHKPFRG